MDMFSTRRNALLRRRFTLDPGDEDAIAVDAFQQDWSQENGWANPPFDNETFRKLVDKVIADGATISVVAPLWKRAPWYQDLVALSVACPRLLPRRHDLFRPGPDNDHGVGVPPDWLETAVFRISGIPRERDEFARKLTSESFPPNVRNAGRLPTGKLLPFYRHDVALPARFDAKIHESVSMEISSTTAITREDDDGYEMLNLATVERKKAYGMVTANGKAACCLFDTGSQGDLMSLEFYKRSCRRLPLTPYQGTVRGFNNAVSSPKGVVTIRVTIGDRRVLLPFLVIDASLDDLLLGQTTMAALNIDIMNSANIIRVGGKKAKTFSEVLMLPSATSARPTAVGHLRKMRAKEDVTLPPWNAVFLDATVPEVAVQDIFVESLPNSAAVYVLKGVTTARRGTALINVANLSDKPRRIRRGQALGIYGQTDGTDCSTVQLDFDSYGDAVAGPAALCR